MSCEEDIYWYQLAWVKNIGAVTFKALLDKFKNAKLALKKVKTVQKNLEIPSVENVSKTLEEARFFKIKPIKYTDSDYPSNLKKIKQAPVLLWSKGNNKVINEKKKYIGIIGTRNPSLQAVAFTKKITKDLLENNYIIVSGLAVGIDTIAHLTSIRKKPFSVIASGLKNITPKKNVPLFEKIVENGVAISTIKHDENFQKYYYFKRNALIAGICSSLLVVEANVLSGSLNTISEGIKYGKKIFAVPGHPLNRKASGCNKILKEGMAYLVEDVKDILKNDKEDMLSSKKETSFLKESYNFEVYKGNDKEILKRKIMAQIKTKPTKILEIVKGTAIEISIINAVVFELELDGRIVRTSENEVQKKTNL